MNLSNIVLKNNICEFVPLHMGVIDVYDLIQVKELYDLKKNEDVSLLLDVTHDMTARDFIKQVYGRAYIWAHEYRNVYVAKQRDGIVLGLVSTQPVRSFELSKNLCQIDYAVDVLLSEPEQITGLKKLFSKAYHHEMNDCTGFKNTIMQENFFVPMQNEQLKLFMRVSEPNAQNRSVICPSYLSNLMSIMPIQLNPMGSDFSIKKLTSSRTLGKMVYSLIEKNRSDVEQFLPGISEKCTSPETTTAYLTGNADSQPKHMILNYGIFASNKLVGMFNCPVQSLSAKINMLIDKSVRGKGYASEALRLIEREFFKRGVQEIWIDSHIHNYQTQAVLSRNKYICEIHDESEPFVEYHKKLTDYTNGWRADESLLKTQHISQPQKVQSASIKPLTVNYARESRS